MSGLSDSKQNACRAVLIAAPASGQGKTTVTAALARQARARGERVRVFKTGPDFLDPTILAQASGAPVYQLDLFMGGEAHCRALLAQAAREADLILVEGVMGLFDGAPSSADLAQRLGLPVLAVMDGSAMAQTFGALAHGLKHFRAGLSFAGVIANRVGSQRHADMLFESLPADIPAVGWLPRDAALSLPERHLGLVAASELADIGVRLDRAAAALQWFGTELPVVAFESLAAAQVPAASLHGRTIAIARDEAFAFTYPANLDTLAALGAQCVFFSPLNDVVLPACDAVWLPGGYPELHVSKLASNAAMRNALHAHHASGKPLLAECGGMMSLFEDVELTDGTRHAGFGLLPGHVRMQKRFAALGMQAIDLPEGTLRGHSFHYSTLDTALQPIARATNPNDGPTREPVYRQGRLTASYIHLYFASNPSAVAALFGA
ncbi:cobyrinate a,c-diamide synthase [Uliginosibacterium sp. H3]|uniref:Cobyrinate a,c-diamide synthase n=1 Tax=Uliginosibacterium silvisoli TaxID=3114758 RepID=A0ABU6K0D1_9RHOO|nr:cobyrinate a,c-diamide synthase [Uliginosibacterium sp. H3]